ncbi:MAG: energy-coupling factor ABC transporter ATP-binding protein [Clostridiales Family XIII bacterium]|jgi:energy-coupling factor transporter ATP-binding protein EcfA2|nr:energy-coupling factor ABC transporter ATP-binding protein [Clostridiales Family XIII bacterium]
MIDVRNLTYTYPEADEPALIDVSLHVGAGELCVLIGPSGCGKTTLCRRIAAGCGGAAGDAGVGFVLQEPDHQIVMTAVEDDAAFGPENLLVPPGEVRARVDATLGALSLSGMELRDPGTLSGGEKQRLAIAGVLTMRPGALLFDEPASGLDAAGRAAFCDIARELRAQGHAVLVVEHDFEFLDFADRWVLMKGGRILCDAPPADVPTALLEDELWR